LDGGRRQRLRVYCGLPVDYKVKKLLWASLGAWRSEKETRTKAMDKDDLNNTSRINRSSVIRFVVLIFIIAGTVALFRATDVGQYFTKDSISNTIDGIRSFESRFGIFGPIMFWLLGSLAIVVNVPTLLVIWFAVMTYGPVVGAVEGVLCLNTASLLIYFISRSLGRDFVNRVFGRRFSKIEDRFEQGGFMTVVYLRLFFFMVPPLNWFLGLMNLKFRDFFLGTMAGTLHHVILNAWIAGVGIEIIKEGRSLLFWKSPELAPPLIIGLLIFIAIRVFDKQRQKRMVEASLKEDL